jgi:hypothetical protein
MSTNTKIALSAALVLGFASAALANDQSEERRWFLLPDSMQGVSPVYHDDLIDLTSNVYGQVASPTVQQDRSRSGKPAYNR